MAACARISTSTSAYNTIEILENINDPKQSMILVTIYYDSELFLQLGIFVLAFKMH